MAASPEPQAVIDLGDPGQETAIPKIDAALKSPTAIEFVNTPLKDVVEYLKNTHKIEIHLDSAALKEAGVDANSPVTKNIKGVSLRSALRLMLDELQLKYVIHNEVLLITSPAKAESDEYMATRLYPVKDLVLLVRNVNDEIEIDFRPLKDLITNCVAAKSWAENGGAGTISEYQFQDRCMLVVSQTQEVHEEIVTLLAALRKAGGDVKKGGELRLPSAQNPSPTPTMSCPPDHCRGPGWAGWAWAGYSEAARTDAPFGVRQFIAAFWSAVARAPAGTVRSMVGLVAFFKTRRSECKSTRCEKR